MAPTPPKGPNLPGQRILPKRPLGNEKAPVEMERIDPKQILKPQGPVPTRPHMEDGMANLERIDTKRPRPPMPQENQEPAPPPRVEEAPPPLLDQIVSNDLIAQLQKEFGYEPEKLFEVELNLEGKTLPLTVRKPVYDDFVWTMALIERKIQTAEDASLLMTGGQREAVVSHYVAARCVLKIKGQWIWDVFKARKQIEAVNPHWVNDVPKGVPDFLYGTMAVQVYGLLRTLHPDALFALDRIVDALDGSDGVEDTPPKDVAVKGPTQSA